MTFSTCLHLEFRLKWETVSLLAGMPSSLNWECGILFLLKLFYSFELLLLGQVTLGKEFYISMAFYLVKRLNNNKSFSVSYSENAGCVQSVIVPYVTIIYGKHC